MNCRNGEREWRKCKLGDVTKPISTETRSFYTPPTPAPTVDPCCVSEDCSPCCDVEPEEFWEAFEAEIVVDCDEDDDEDSSGTTISLSPALDGAFLRHAQDKEDCGVYDNGGFMAALRGKTVGNRELQVNKKKPRRRRRKRLKARGRGKKRGRCRRKCASRNVKADDALSDPERRFLRDVATVKSRNLQAPSDVGICTADAPSNLQEGSAPDLLKSLNEVQNEVGFSARMNEVQSEVGFSARKADITNVLEYQCGADSPQCNKDGSHLCCGVEGCSCSLDPVDSACIEGTTLPDGSVKPCFLSGTGSLDEYNLCCNPSSYATECMDICGFTFTPTSQPTISTAPSLTPTAEPSTAPTVQPSVSIAPSSTPSARPSFDCELAIGQHQSYNETNDSIDIRLTVTNICVGSATVERLVMTNCVLCVNNSTKVCTPSRSILPELEAANELSDIIPANEERVIWLTTAVDERSYQGDVCDYKSEVDYDVTAVVQV
eukprot:CAMPEP_0178684834 /NCGR_PEP_ID=MMETSP0699-20121125/3060_1 /TAXON_ID=265572 /ORGANISM="Extubocellulus spinifer, Strain CCMP396" /LENGTH=489 /DNA_ID=CAMNT_0020329545 /DNA_START=193 /DNA_END=1663 /DNA_ORIENTATION=-